MKAAAEVFSKYRKLDYEKSDFERERERETGVEDIDGFDDAICFNITAMILP
jgi:hypothetical protein